MQEVATTPAAHDLLNKAQTYLAHREKGLCPGRELEAGWGVFYERYSRTIRKFAFTCGTVAEDIDECVQEVWTELLVRLPAFRLDPKRGQFDSWLFRIVQGKTVNLRRIRERRLLQGNADALSIVADHRPNPGQTQEEEELIRRAWEQLREALSECSFQVLRLRLVEQLPVAEVAERLGLSREQVWYRYHRAQREVKKLGASWARGQRRDRAQTP